MSNVTPTKSSLGRIGSFFSTVGAVFDVATSVNARRLPSTRSLRTLGIDEETFRKIHL